MTKINTLIIIAILTLLLAALVATPAPATGTWSATATIDAIHVVDSVDAAPRTSLILSKGQGRYQVVCANTIETADGEAVSVCDTVVPGETWTFHGLIRPDRGRPVLVVREILPAAQAETR